MTQRFDLIGWMHRATSPIFVRVWIATASSEIVSPRTVSDDRCAKNGAVWLRDELEDAVAVVVTDRTIFFYDRPRSDDDSVPV